MSEPVRWHLQYMAALNDDPHLMRRHYEQLRADPNVAEITVYEDFDSPMVREMDVTFRAGWAQPVNPELWFLNQRFPMRKFRLTAWERLLKNIDEK